MTIEDLSFVQRLRLEFIEYRLEYFGFVNRSVLIEQFNYGPANASRDIALYKELANQNLTLAHENKRYLRTQQFLPVFVHCKYRVLESLVRGFCGVTSSSEYINAFKDLRSLEKITCEDIATVSRAIISQSQLSIIYKTKALSIKPISLMINPNNDFQLCFFNTDNSEQETYLFGDIQI